MNVASKELCQELYELSSWGRMDRAAGPTEWYHNRFWQNNEWAWRVEYWTEVANQAMHLHLKLDKGKIVPAYDLGYLLRKLPQNTTISKGLARRYYFGYSPGSGKRKLYQSSDTPEDVACKLAIELFKQGVLPAPQSTGEQG